MGENGEKGGGKQDEAEDACFFTKVRSKICTEVEDPETKKPIFKCEKVEMLLKLCPIRNEEEDNTEAIEDELSSLFEQFGFHRDRGDQPDRESEARRSPHRTFPGEQEQEPPDEYWDYRKEFKEV